MNESATEYMRAKKAQRYDAIARGYIDRSGSLHIDEYSNVSVIPLGQLKNITETPTIDILIDDCDYCARIERQNRDAVPCSRIRGKVLYGGFLRSQWGHFLLNSTSRLWPLYTQAIENVDYILFFSDTLKEYVPSGNYKEFFELAGISDKLIIASGTVEVEHLIVPEIAFEQKRFFSREAMAVFNAVKSAIAPMPGIEFDTKILLTRSALPNADRNEINISKIDSLFGRNGYKIVYPEKENLKSLVNMMKNASSIASFSGSTAHNFVFADSGSEFIIIERSGVNNIFQIGISLMSGQNPIHIDGYFQPKISPSTGSLFLYGATDNLERFIADRAWHTHTFDKSKRARKRELRKFVKRHFSLNGHSTGVEEWAIDEMPAVSEAYIDSYKYYKPWLDRQTPLLLSDYLSPRCLFRALKSKIRECKSLSI